MTTPGPRLLLAVLLVSTRALAQEAPAETTTPRLTGEVGIGTRVVGGKIDSGRFEQHRDPRTGPLGALRLDGQSRSGNWGLGLDAREIGRRDGSYIARLSRHGRLSLDLRYAALPQVFSTAARSPYSDAGAGDTAMSGAVRGRIQSAPPGTAAEEKSGLLAKALAHAPGVPLGFSTRTGGAGLTLRPRPDVSVEVGYALRKRDGYRPQSLGFGSADGSFAGFRSPVDDALQEVTAGAALEREAWGARLEYLGSFYAQGLPHVVVDNPIAAGDRPGMGARGRLAAAPDNSAHQVRLSGAGTVPAPWPVRLAGALAYGLRLQDADFLPYTINAALGDPLLATLPQTTLQGRTDTLLAFLRATARPARKVDLAAGYRFHALLARTPALAWPLRVTTDATLDKGDRTNAPLGYRRHDASLNGSWRPTRGVKARLGYGWERWDRASVREVLATDEHTGRAGVDLRGPGGTVLHGGYRLAWKTGSEYDPWRWQRGVLGADDRAQAFEAASPASLRRYDEADRLLHQADLSASAAPLDSLSGTVTASYGVADHVRTTTGLLQRQAWAAGADLAWQPHPRVEIGAFYSFEHARRVQAARWRPAAETRAGDDPANDWSSRSVDLAHTAAVHLQVRALPGLLDLGLSYLVNDGVGRTLASAAAGTTDPGADGGNAFDYPDLRDLLQHATASARLHLGPRVELRASYSYQFLEVDDFRTETPGLYAPASNVNGSGAVTPSLDVFPGARQGDYLAHVVELMLTYRP